MKSIVYIVTVRSNTTFKTDTLRIEIPANDDPKKRADIEAASYGGWVVSFSMENPVDALRDQLRECLGFIEAWQFHLSDTGEDGAAALVKSVHESSRNVYLHSAPV